MTEIRPFAIIIKTITMESGVVYCCGIKSRHSHKDNLESNPLGASRVNHQKSASVKKRLRIYFPPRMPLDSQRQEALHDLCNKCRIGELTAGESIVIAARELPSIQTAQPHKGIRVDVKRGRFHLLPFSYDRINMGVKLLLKK